MIKQKNVGQRIKLLKDKIMDLEKLKNGTEQELREIDRLWPETKEELYDIISTLENRSHDYGTSALSMGLAAEAAFNYIARQVGCTGFQSSCADLNFLARNRDIKNGFMIINFDDLLYPQYKRKISTWDELIYKNRENLAKAAKEKLEKYDDAHPIVVKHWKYLVSLGKTQEDA